MTLLYDPALQPLDIGLEPQPTPQAPLRRRAVRRLATWLRASAVDLVLLALLLALGGYVHAAGMFAVPARFDDEGTYTAYAWAVQHWGQLSHYTYWYAHPPLGWIQMAGWTWLTGGFERAPYAVAAVRELMLVVKLVDIVLLYALTRRLRLGRSPAVLAVLLFSLSPLAVYFTRAALLDNIVTPWLLAAFLIAAAPRRSLLGAASSSACMAVAVLSKETALLYLPAVLVLFLQRADRRNRRFTVSLFTTVFVLICAAYPIFALTKNELLQGQGHVSLEWAVRWQLFDRTGSGDVFDPNSTAHAVIRSWIQLDPWLPKLSLLLVVPALVMRRTRAVALAFALQVVQLLRNGYLPYPYVIAMLPFGALVIAAVLGRASGALWFPTRPGVRKAVARARRALRLPHDAHALDPEATTAITLPDRRPWDTAPHGMAALHAFPASFGAAGRPLLTQRNADQLSGWWPRRVVRRSRRRWLSAWQGLPRHAFHVTSAVGVAWLLLIVGQSWQAPLADLRLVSRDEGKAEALHWVIDNVPRSAYLVVDDSYWVDLVNAGFAPSHVVWFTKLDVDSAVKLPARPQWKGIDYVVVDHQDDLSLHVQDNGKPSQATLAMFPTIGQALRHVSATRTFGVGLDAISIRTVDPRLVVPTARSRSAANRAAGRPALRRTAAQVRVARRVAAALALMTARAAHIPVYPPPAPLHSRTTRRPAPVHKPPVQDLHPGR
jgi:Dolichyl-phosphate-mannose-protein mannosyltransferase